MQVNVDNKNKIFCIFLSHDDEQRPDVQEQYAPLFQEYKQKKYCVAVFHSGNENLEDLTSALIQYNRKKREEQEMTAEKKAERASAILQ